jgi:hypothetical protein
MTASPNPTLAEVADRRPSVVGSSHQRVPSYDCNRLVSYIFKVGHNCEKFRFVANVHFPAHVAAASRGRLAVRVFQNKKP